MKKKKLKLLLPISNCCLKKFYDLDAISRYGSISVILFMISSQIFNMVNGYDYKISFISMIINIFFLMVILIRLEMIKVNYLDKYVNKILIFIIIVLIFNFFGYLSSDIQLYNYVHAPLSFLGAYFILLLLLKG